RQPEQEQEQTGLADAVPRCVVEDQCDELREREDVGEVEEELDRVGREVFFRLRYLEAAHPRTVPVPPNPRLRQNFRETGLGNPDANVDLARGFGGRGRLSGGLFGGLVASVGATRRVPRVIVDE